MRVVRSGMQGPLANPKHCGVAGQHRTIGPMLLIQLLVDDDGLDVLLLLVFHLDQAGFVAAVAICVEVIGPLHSLVAFGRKNSSPNFCRSVVVPAFFRM